MGERFSENDEESESLPINASATASPAQLGPVFNPVPQVSLIAERNSDIVDVDAGEFNFCNHLGRVDVVKSTKSKALSTSVAFAPEVMTVSSAASAEIFSDPVDELDKAKKLIRLANSVDAIRNPDCWQ